MGGSATADVFISYSRNDTVAADLIRRELEEAGLEVFLDRSIAFTADWRQFIREALEKARSVVVLVGQAGPGEYQQIEVGDALEVCTKYRRHLGAVLLPGAQPTAVSHGPLAKYQWFDCSRDSVKRLAEGICARLGRTAAWGGCQFGPQVSIAAPFPGGRQAPLRVHTLANAASERLPLSCETFEAGIERLEKQIEASGRGWHPILVGVNPTGFAIAAALQQRLFGGAPLGYYSEGEGHTIAWPEALTSGRPDRTVFVVDSELKTGRSLLNVVEAVRTRCGGAEAQLHLRVAAFGVEVTGKRVTALQEDYQGDPDPAPYPPEVMRAWGIVSGLNLDALYIACLMDGPGTRRPLQLR